MGLPPMRTLPRAISSDQSLRSSCASWRTWPGESAPTLSTTSSTSPTLNPRRSASWSRAAAGRLPVAARIPFASSRSASFGKSSRPCRPSAASRSGALRSAMRSSSASRTRRGRSCRTWARASSRQRWRRLRISPARLTRPGSTRCLRTARRSAARAASSSSSTASYSTARVSVVRSTGVSTARGRPWPTPNSPSSRRSA